MELLRGAVVFLVFVAIVQARSAIPNKDLSFGDETELDFQDDFQAPSNHARVARDLVHRANWTAFGTVSSLKSILDFPMVSVSSVADSRMGAASTGRIYFYMAKESLKYKDLVRKNQATLLFSGAQDYSCQARGIDPMEPTCSRTMITGKVVQLKNGTENFIFGRAAFVSRHSAAKDWLEVHGMVLCQLQIQQVLVIDFYGGSKTVSVDEYYSVKAAQEEGQSFRFGSEKNDFEQRFGEKTSRQQSRRHSVDPPSDHAKVARELVHRANWTSFGTVSTINEIRGYPMVSISSVADSRTADASTGQIYFYVAKESIKYKDLLAQNQATMLFSAAQDNGCQVEGVDPMEPTCSRAMLSGNVFQLKNGTIEFEFGRAAFVDRHPVAKDWLEVHGMVLCQLQIEQILVIDFYGGSKTVSTEDYYNASLDSDKVSKEHTLGAASREVLSESGILSDRWSEEYTNDRVHVKIHKSHGDRVIDIYV